MSKKRASVAQAAVSVAILTIVSKLLGFGREALIASYFGASASTDAFFFAHSMPEMVFPSVCNSIATAFITLYVGKLAVDNIEGNRYASRMFSQSMLIGIGLAVIGVFLSPYLVELFAPGFNGEQVQLATRLTRITMAAFVLIMVQYMMTAILNSNKIFISSQIAGLLYNVFVISVTFLFHEKQSMEELTLTVVCGSILLVLTLFVFSKIYRIPIRISARIEKGELSVLLKLALPIILGNAVVQINTIVDKIIGSLLPSGSVSALSYSTTLCNIVTGVFITSLSTVLYPTLSHDAAKNDTRSLNDKIEKSITVLFVVLIPVSIITCLDSRTIVSFVYGRGNFDATAIDYTSNALLFYGPMFAFYGVREVISRSFFAIKDSKTPMINTSIGVGLNIILSIIFTKLIGIGGIALGTSISTAVTALLLLYNGKKKIEGFNIKQILWNIIKILAAACATTALMTVLNHYLQLSGIVELLFDTFLCVCIYLVFLIAVNRKAIKVVLDLFRK